jgi:GAF domain-containing protein/sugar diacid utilization regulator
MGTRHTDRGGTDDVPVIAVLPRLADERAYLYGIIRTIGSGPDLRSILSGVVRLATEATQCHACLIWFLEGDRLVLRSSSEPYSPLAGSLSVAMGEGLVGWVARTRRSAFIVDGALDDPRVKYFPELEEEHFQSLVSVPVFDRDGEVMGVISLHAEAPHEFAREDLEFLEHTASLTAGAVENARLYEESTARVDVLTDLSRLSRRIAAATEMNGLLTAVVRGTCDLLTAARCEIFLMDADGRLRQAAAEPVRSNQQDLTAEVAVRIGPRPIDPGDFGTLATALWGDTYEGTPLLEPLTVGDDVLGLLAVLTPSPAPAAETALPTIAAHTAVAIRQHELVERLLEKNLVSEFFGALSRKEGIARATSLAARLGIDLSEQHVVVAITPWADDRDGRASGAAWHEVAATVEAGLSTRVNGAVFDRTEQTIRALVPLRDAADRIVEDLGSVLASVGTAGLSVGISDPTTDTASYPGAFEEARAAADIGPLLRGGPGVTEFHGLGGYRYVLTSPDMVRTIDRRRLDRLVAYDARRGTTLLDTLERFLDERGNVVGTARSLYIHPNTLRQRLERIEDESGFDLEREDWLSLAIAVKVVKLGLLRSRSYGGGNHDG